MAISRDTPNTDRQASYYDAKIKQSLEMYLFKDIGFAEHLKSTHWRRLFDHCFQDIRGQRVLDIGCGTGWTSLLLAQRGAYVTSVDISARQIEILLFNAAHYGLIDRVSALAGDITLMGLPAGSFDLCLGAAFLHHLEHEEETTVLREIHRLLAPGGTAWFVEPAVNSRMLDRLRYLVPMPNRPACWMRNWAEHRQRDPHPDRDNSSRHFRRIGRQIFADVEVEPLGILNRLERLTGDRGKQWIHRMDHRVSRLLPSPLREPLCRVQIIRYRKAAA